MAHAVVFSDDDGLRTVELSAGEGNLLNPANLAELREVLMAADAEPDVWGILLAASGAVFCGGLDIAAIRAGANAIDFASGLVELLHVFPRLTKPIVAAVQGDALASGASLVAAVDYAVVVPHALLGSQEVSVGIWPMIAQVPLIHRLGVRPALENIGSGVPYTADRAKELGLVQEIASAGSLRRRALAWLGLVRRGGAAYATGRPFLYELAQMSYDDALDAALDKFSSMFSPQP